MTILLALALAAATADCALPAAEQERQITSAYDAFDTSAEPTGWRAYNARGCVDTAVALLKAYRDRNAARLTAEQAREMPFHIAQAYAFNGRDGEALLWVEQADASDAPEEWRAFVAAHIAFFKHNRTGLVAARARYAAVTKPGSMRLMVIDGFLKCPDKSYMKAAHCAM